MLMSVRYLMETVDTTVSTLKEPLSVLAERDLLWEEIVKHVQTLMSVYLVNHVITPVLIYPEASDVNVTMDIPLMEMEHLAMVYNMIYIYL